MLTKYIRTRMFMSIHLRIIILYQTKALIFRLQLRNC